MNNRLKYTVPLVLFAMTIMFTFNNSYDDALTCFFLMFGYILVLALKRNGLSEEGDTNSTASTAIRTPLHVYYGDELNLGKETITGILIKYFPYFRALDTADRKKFLKRLADFMDTKTFKIHDQDGFREMPVLISAAAIQLTFGLGRYLLPQFEFIHIYPEEFLHRNAAFNFLEGNVSGQSINISWKHFLEGYQVPDDGQNVGLHEMAHAYYWQNFITKDNIDRGFVSTFPGFNSTANKVFEQEKKQGNDLYSDYALKNSHEFWAESIEIFFEKPVQLKLAYPELYDSLKILLNQDPLQQMVSTNG